MLYVNEVQAAVCAVKCCTQFTHILWGLPPQGVHWMMSTCWPFWARTEIKTCILNYQWNKTIFKWELFENSFPVTCSESGSTAAAAWVTKPGLNTSVTEFLCCKFMNMQLPSTDKQPVKWTCWAVWLTAVACWEVPESSSRLHHMRSLNM